jgi:hypothetical protein
MQHILATHMIDGPNRPRYLVTLTDEEFARLDPGRRRLYNLLRQQLGRSPIPEPATDLSPKPDVPAPKLFDKPSPLAHALIRDENNRVLWQVLLIDTEARLAAHDSNPRIKRPANRPKMLSRKIAEHATTTLLGVWDRLAPQQRVTQSTVLGWIRSGYGISRTVALELLQEARKCARRLQHTTDE